MIELLIESFFLCSFVMCILFVISIFTHNMSYVDFGWSINFSLIVLYLFYKFREVIENPIIVTCFIMVLLWSFRLAFYLLFTRILFKPEEGRYVRLRKTWKKHLYLKFFIFFQFQAVTNAILSIPFFIALSQSQNFEFNHYFAIILFIIGFIGESLADFHLYVFKRNPANHNKTLNTGLWKYSRHPNYFFELVIWFSYGLYQINLEYGYIAFSSFLILLYFILKVTGIPATEEQNLSTKGEEYKNYIQTTSPLIPLPNSIYQRFFKRG